MSFLHPLAAVRTAPLALLLAAGACAQAPTSGSGIPTTTPAQVSAASMPVLLSCPAGQQPLLRQVTVGGTLVPQVECVMAASPAVAPAAPGYPVSPHAFAPQMAAAPVPVPAAWASTEVRPLAPPAPAVGRRPAARRVAYDDVMEIQRPARRSWQKSAVIIGSAAGVGAGVGAATGGKKGALIGAAVGGGAATIWDQVTRRRPR